MNIWGAIQPVPDRSCGACTVCCDALAIDDPALRKPADTPCANLRDGVGCSIHDTRPHVCRVWFCGWRMIAGLPQDWRPDTSRILVYPRRCTEPGFGANGLKLTLLGDIAPLGDPKLLTFVGQSIGNGMPLYFSLHVRGRPEFDTFLNVQLADAVARRDGTAMIAQLRAIADAQLRQMER